MLSAPSDHHQQQQNLIPEKKKNKIIYLGFLPFPLLSSVLSQGDPASPGTTGGSAIARLTKHLGTR